MSNEQRAINVKPRRTLTKCKRVGCLRPSVVELARCYELPQLFIRVFVRRLAADASGVSLTALFLLGGLALHAAAADRSSEVAIVYNKNVADSKSVAEHYATRRQVPTNQIVGLDLPGEETISRKDFLDRLQRPLLAFLESSKAITYGAATNKAQDGREFRKVVEARVRYLALCYGVPLRILRDDSLVEPGTDRLPEPMMKRNEAAVDSQLAIALLAEQGFPWTGLIGNPFFAATNAAMMSPVNGLFIVTRLDGPSPAIARGLVDKALEAETNGLWGRAYVDARGLATNDNYYPGDVMMKGAADIVRRLGFETVFDERPQTFSVGFPMSQIAIYAGWYDQAISGPFTRSPVEFMPGAFAYHLYSFGASTIRGTNTWAGRFLAQGVTCTFGAVDEPYLAGTPDVSQFLLRWGPMGFTFGEAAYAAQPSLSWQTTVIGDPLYRPFGRKPDDLLADLERRKSPLLDWYFLVAVNQQIVNGASGAVAIRALESFEPARRSAILTEKLADLYWARGSMTDAIDTYEAAMKRGASKAQYRRLLLGVVEKKILAGPDDEAMARFRKFVKEYPDDPELLRICEAILPVAKRQNLTNDITTIEAEIKRLSKP